MGQRNYMLLLRESGRTQSAITTAMGVSLSTMNDEPGAHVCDQGGLKALEPKSVGGSWPKNMELAAEGAVLNRFAKAVGVGEMFEHP
jgi:hypothetical protein